MAHTHLVQPQIPFGLDNQTQILNQLYHFDLNTCITQEELERTWDVLSKEEPPHVIV